MKQRVKTVLCLLMVCILTIAPLTNGRVYAATQFSYPDSVNESKAQELVSKTDDILLFAAQSLGGKSLSESVMNTLYSSDLLSSLLIEIYKSLNGEDMKDMLSMLKIAATPNDLAAALFAYPEIASVLSAAQSWDSVNLDGKSWNIGTKSEFAAATGAVMAPLYPMMSFLLCEGTVNIVGNVIKQNGDKGYETAIIPIFKALGCTKYLSYDEFKKQATVNSQALVGNLILPLLDYAENVLAKPITNLCALLPNLAHFILNDGFEKAIDSLLAPVKEITEIIGKIPLLSQLLSGSASGLTTDFSGNLVPDINTLLNSGEMKLTIPEIDWELLASCGKLSGDTVTAEKGKTFIVVFRWLWETLQKNRSVITDLMGDAVAESDMLDTQGLTEILDAFMKDDADTVLKALCFMYNPSVKPMEMYWTFGKIETKAFPFTESMPRENYAKMASGFNTMLSSLIAEMMGTASLYDALKVSLYTNDNITSVIKSVYAALSGEEISGIADMLGIDVSLKTVLSELTEKQYKEAVSFLSRYADWSQVPADGISWGFSDGDRKGFVNTVAALLRPLLPLLDFLLCGEDYVFMNAITVRGGNGYNGAMIPFFEALGVDPDDYPTFAEYKKGKGTDSILTSLLNPLLIKLENISKAPIAYLTEQLPTLCYFISDGGLQKMLYALGAPILVFISGSGLSVSIDELLEKILEIDLTFGEAQVNKLIKQLQTGENTIALPALPALTELASLGTLYEAPSKRTFEGKPTTYKLVVADKESVTAYLVDFIVSFMQMPENANLLTGSFAAAGQEDASNPFASYTDSITAELSGMSHDDMIKWIYDMLVFEPSEPIQEENQTMQIPRIIYEPEEEKSNAGLIAVPIVLVVIAIGVVVILQVKKKKATNKNTKKEETEE